MMTSKWEKDTICTFEYGGGTQHLTLKVEFPNILILLDITEITGSRKRKDSMGGKCIGAMAKNFQVFFPKKILCCWFYIVISSMKFSQRKKCLDIVQCPFNNLHN